jgi:hypothetical protein
MIMPFTHDLLQFKNPVFFETGTYQGDTIQYILSTNIFQEIFTMELSPHYHAFSSQRFSAVDNVHTILGNSRTDLYDNIKKIQVPITFWLDGHWSGVPHIGEDNVTRCPVLFELDQIKRHLINTHTIMIDDIRLMDNHHFPVTKYEIEQKLREINPAYTIQYFADDLDKEDVLVAYLK